MKLRTCLASVLGLGCVAALMMMAYQAWEKARLQAREREIQSRLTASTTETKAPSSPAPAAQSEPATAASLSDQEVLELMRLRNEATRLRQRQRELAPVRAENTVLRAQQMSAATNASGANVGLPAGYIRRRDAQNAGTSTPEATLQTFIYAMSNRDANLLLRTVDEEQAQHLKAALNSPQAEERWAEAKNIPGFRVIKSTPRSNTEIELEVEFAPEMTTTMMFKKVGTEWKMGN